MSLKLKLSAIPADQFRTAVMAFAPEWADTSRADQVNMFEGRIAMGALTLEQIREVGLTQAKQVMTVPSSGAGSIAGIDQRLAALEAALPAMTAAANFAGDAVKQAESVAFKVDSALKAVESAVNNAVTASVEASKAAKQALSESKRSAADVAKVRADLPNLNAEAVLRDLVIDAFKPYREAVEAKGEQAKAIEVASAAPVGRVSTFEAFGVALADRRGIDLTVAQYNHPGAPSIDPNFIWTDGILRHLVLAEMNGENLWFGGEKGTGKSETARQFAARTGRPFVRINFHKYSEAADYLGTTGIVDGDTVFTPGDFLMAFTTPGAVILLDEPSNIDPGEAAPLNGFLEPDSAVSWGGKVWRKAPGVIVCAADNTMGSGDDSGRYAGTRVQNSALIDRFARVIRFDYLPLEQEVDAVVRHTGCDRELAEHVLLAVRVARAEVTKANVVDAPSIRSVLAFIRSLSVLTIDEAWASAVTNRQPTESAAALDVIRKTHLNDSLIKRFVGGV